MKKQVRVITAIIMIIAILFSIMNVAYAATAKQTLDDVKKGDTVNLDDVTNLGQKIVGIMQIVGVVIAVVVLLVIGIKYLIGSAEERAEYKKTMIPYLVGAILIFASTTMVRVVYNIANAVNDNQ